MPIGLVVMISLTLSCASSNTTDRIGLKTFQSAFDDLAGWQDDSAKGSPQSYSLTKGILRIFTRPQTRDRVKIRTHKRFGVGRYSWRVFVPAMGKNDQASIGAFLYRDDTHEVDFEIGYGKASLRENLKAQDTDLVCYCTSQGYPFSSHQILIKKEAWYVLSIDITNGKDGNYLIRWLINDKQVHLLQTDFGDEVTFTAHCSVENLLFIGDHIPKEENYALFDFFSFVSSVTYH